MTTSSFGYGDFSNFGVTPPTDVAAQQANQITNPVAPTVGGSYPNSGMSDKQRQMLASSLMGMGQQKAAQGQAGLQALAGQQIAPVNGMLPGGGVTSQYGVV